MSIAALAIIGPLAAAALVLLIRRHAAGLTLAGAVVALIASVSTLTRVAGGDRFAATVPGLPDWPLMLVVDPLGAIFSTVVAVVSTFVLVYAVGYMADEEDQVRFFGGMAFFTAAMQTLVLAGDWLLLLAAWELIGLASYLLIGFWFARPGTGAAATRAFVVTRAADAGLYLGVIIVIVETGTTSIAAAGNLSGLAATVAGLAFLLAAAGKSAQAPLQGWLQDAMAGPTPVSALLHAATLVVAGVVLLARSFPLLPGNVLLIVGLAGGISSVITGLTAAAQRDLKRLLAASTSSQLGLMFLALGAGSVPAAVFHLVAHAAMKSALFLAAGIFQHDRDSTAFADLRGIGKQRRAPFAAFVVAGLALAGVPPLAGFWSKDAVLAAALHSSFGVVFVPLALVAMTLTGVYVGRACRLLWREGEATPEAAGDAGNMTWMGLGLGALALLAAGLGIAAAPIGRVLGEEIPEDFISVALGLVAAAGGLLLGWYVPAARLFGTAVPALLAGFRIGDGWTDVVVRPALLMGHGADRVDRIIHGGMLGVGQRALDIASRSRATDERVHHGVRLIGRSSLVVARASQALDR
ncbi:MAG: NADH-quinone oxidoreductase subunit L, partial [Chloroflexota bacterium]|nr:NADH-quinone oxidoreductase subunit L [Chloroflexota bacterium]